MPIAAPMITRPTPMARRSENGAAAAASRPAGGRLGLGGRRALREQEQADGQDGGLDEFHRTLDSWMVTRREGRAGRTVGPPRARGPIAPRLERDATPADRSVARGRPTRRPGRPVSADGPPSR